MAHSDIEDSFHVPREWLRGVKKLVGTRKKIGKNKSFFMLML